MASSASNLFMCQGTISQIIPFLETSNFFIPIYSNKYPYSHKRQPPDLKIKPTIMYTI